MDSPRNHDDESSVSSMSDEEDWEDCYTPGEPYSDAIDKIERNNLDGHRFLAISERWNGISANGWGYLTGVSC